MPEQEMDLSQAEGWRPTEGDTLIGKVVDLDKGWSDYTNDFYPIVTVEQESGEKTSIHCFHAALKSRMTNLRPTIGEMLGIQYHGKVPTKDGKREVATYTVKVAGRTSDNFWGSAPVMQSDVPAPDVPQETDQGGDDIPF